MGQYYKAVILTQDKKEVDYALSSYDYGNGAKLTEHSYIRNDFVNAVLNTIGVDGANLVWAGDYAKAFEGSKYNLYSLAEEKGNYIKDANTDSVRFIINETKGIFIDIYDSPFNLEGLAIHPIPLLCSEGNGEGGGDYEGINMELVGSWRGDEIRIAEDTETYSVLQREYIPFEGKFIESYSIERMEKFLKEIKK